MKLSYIILALAPAIGAHAQANVDMFRDVPPAIALGLAGGSVPFGRPLSSWPDWTWHKTNINFVVDTPAPCPPEYTNVLSNTNLFSDGEQRLLNELPLKYGKATMDSPPAGDRLVEKARQPSKILLSAFKEVRWEATNSEAQIRAFFMRSDFNRGPEKLAEVDFITKSGGGYEAVFGFNGHCVGFLQLEHGQLDGLCAEFRNGRCVVWSRYKAGMLVGKYLVWNETGTLYMEAEFKEPYDFLHHMTLSE